jgi:redox-sensing transcriptional repressor
MDVNKNIINRLSMYKNSLKRMKSLGFSRVYSDNIADALGISSALVRKDFSEFNITGKKKGGYLINDLIKELNIVLGKDREYNIIIAGIGKIGKALLEYKGFIKEGQKIIAGFDIDTKKINSKLDVPILPLNQLKEFVKENHIDIGIITVPRNAAQQILEEMVDAGIIGILNFAPIQLISNKNVIIYNHSIEMELENLIYYVNKIKNI